MPKDYLKKEPSRTEKALYDLFMRVQMLDREVVSTSAHAVALGLLNNIKPEIVAELLVNGEEKIKLYSEAINKEIARLHNLKNPKMPEENKL